MSVFKLLYDMGIVMLGKSNKLQGDKAKTVVNVVYRRILWGKYYIYNLLIFIMKMCIFT